MNRILYMIRLKGMTNVLILMACFGYLTFLPYLLLFSAIFSVPFVLAGRKGSLLLLTVFGKWLGIILFFIGICQIVPSIPLPMDWDNVINNTAEAARGWMESISWTGIRTGMPVADRVLKWIQEMTDAKLAGVMPFVVGLIIAMLGGVFALISHALGKKIIVRIQKK